MTSKEASRYQVVLSGRHPAPGNPDDLIHRLQSRFKVSTAQAASMLKGRCVVKRDVDAEVGNKFVAALRDLGLDAALERMAEAVASSTPTVAAAPKRAEPARAAAPTGASATAQACAVEPQSSDSAARAAIGALQSLADQKLARPRTTFSYVAGLLIVTLLCVAVPLLYVGLTVVVAYGWIWYLTHIHHHLPRNIHLIVLMYAVPGVVGAIVLLFLARPLFASRRRADDPVKLDEDKERDFVAGVRALCRAIGVAPPIEIRLSCDANASVHYRSRWLSLFTGHKVLTIGMALVAGLTARQFVGVLAHEFGHFAQRFGMICSFTVNSVNAWLEQCAYGDDPWGDKLREWSDREDAKDSWLSGVLGLSVAATWLAIRGTRLLMAGLFHVSFRLSRYMSRQMEFDADRYEALLAGSDTFGNTARSLRALNHAFVEVNAANIEAWREHRLLADLPEAVAIHASEFDKARLAAIEEEMLEHTTTRYWDSHPPDIDRIKSAEKLQAPGIYAHSLPAALLFRDFRGLSQRVTRQFYAEQGVEHKAEHLRPRTEIFGHVHNRNRQREQLNRFFNGQFQLWPLLRLETSLPPAIEALGWQDCIDRIRARSPDIARHWSQASQAHESRALLRTAIKLGASSRQIGLPGNDRAPSVLATELEALAAYRMEFHRTLPEAFALYARRIRHAIEAMNPAERQRAEALLATVSALGALDSSASMLEELAGAIRAFGSIQSSSGEMPAGFSDLEHSFAQTATELLAHADRIEQTTTSDGTVGAYLRARCPDLARAAAGTARALWPIPSAFQHLFLLSVAELVAACEAAENANGLRPIRLVA